jgi:hypothetical protein
MTGHPDAAAFDVISKSWQPIPLADLMIAGLRLRNCRCDPFPRALTIMCRHSG